MRLPRMLMSYPQRALGNRLVRRHPYDLGFRRNARVAESRSALVFAFAAAAVVWIISRPDYLPAIGRRLRRGVLSYTVVRLCLAGRRHDDACLLAIVRAAARRMEIHVGRTCTHEPQLVPCSSSLAFQGLDLRAIENSVLHPKVTYALGESADFVKKMPLWTCVHRSIHAGNPIDHTGVSEISSASVVLA